MRRWKSVTSVSSLGKFERETAFLVFKLTVLLGGMAVMALLLVKQRQCGILF
jgi:hypothetical protein